ncbi:MAG: RecX family transcriptional regulator [Eubacteriales bacterium]
MIVTRLEEVAKNRYKVYLEEQFAFVLYKGELNRYHIKEGEEIEEDIVGKIEKEVVLKRAKKRILYILERMPRTEKQLRDKLKENFYSTHIIDEAIEYAKSFGYIEDEQYAHRFIEDKKKNKSRKEIRYLLLQKGIQKELLDDVLEAAYGMSDDTVAIESLVRKKGYDIENITELEKRKIYSYLMRKGFSYRNICQVLRVSEWNA